MILFFIQIKKSVFFCGIIRGTLILVFGDTQEAVVAAEAVQPRQRGTAFINGPPERGNWRTLKSKVTFTGFHPSGLPS